MTVFGLDESTNVDLADSRRKRGQDGVACFLHLRDLVYLHPQAASSSAISVVQTIEAKVIAEKRAREKKQAESARPRIWPTVLGGSTGRAERDDDLAQWRQAAPSTGLAAGFSATAMPRPRKRPPSPTRAAP
jgi:hypothetical protein